MLNSPDSLRPVQNPVIHINLNCYAEFPPPLQGAQRPQRGRVGVGVSDIIDELKFQFFSKRRSAIYGRHQEISGMHPICAAVA